MEELGQQPESGEPEMEMDEEKYLTFALGEREFGVDISSPGTDPVKEGNPPRPDQR